MLSTASDWAEETFGKCDLSDRRLTKRLIKIGTQLASQIGKSLSFSCSGNEAAIEGSYRFIRNERVDSNGILSGNYKNLIQKAQSEKILLALEDTTSFSFYHSVKREMGSIGGNKDRQTRGIMAHNILLYSPLNQAILGLIEQNFYARKPGETTGKKRKAMNYEQKETYKWESASRKMSERLGAMTMDKVISICDREADLYDYLEYKIKSGQQFIVRAKQNRKTRTMEEDIYLIH